MSIILTKLFNKKVESPVVEANDFILEGVHLHTKLFLGDTYERSINTQLELLKEGNTITKYAALQINGFVIPIPNDMYFGNLKKISLGRSDNTLNSCNAGQRPVYMSLTFYDYKLNVADKFHSVLPVQQKSSDNTIDSIHITTWDFGNIYIKKNYSYMLCKFTLVVDTDQPTCSARSNYIGSRNTLTNQDYKLYLNGWKTIYPVTTNNRYQLYTSYVVVDYDEFIPGINTHIDDYTVHLSEEDRQHINQKFEELDTHVADATKHLTALEKAKLQSLGSDISGALTSHENQEGLHWSTADRTKFSNLEKHTTNATLHVTAADRENWNNKTSHVEAGNFISVSNDNVVSVRASSAISDNTNTVPTTAAVNLAINDVIDKFVNNYSNIYRYEQFSTLDNPKYHQDPAGKLTATGVRMTRRHFTSGDIKTIKFHGYDGVNVANVYLCVIIYNEGEDDSTPKTLSDCIFSSNTQTTTTSSVGGVVFTFDNLVLPDNYKFVKLLFAKNTETFPVSSDGNTVHGVKIQVLRNTEGNTWGEAENDECLVYQSGTNSSGEPNIQDWFPAITCSLLYRSENEVTSINDRLDLLEYASFNPVTPEERELWTNHPVDTDIHVTAEEKEKWNNIIIPEPITYTAGDGIEITDNTISVITTDVIEESNKIPTAKALYNTFYGTRTFNNYDTSKYTAAADTVGTIVLSKKHFIKDCKITKISLPHDKDIDNGEGGHLVIEVFAEDSSKAGGYDKANPIHRYYSDNYYAYKMNTQYGKYEWTFNNTECLIPNDYKVVHLSLVTNDTIVPSIGSSNNNKLRINCLAKSGNRDEGVVYEEDDECTLYWKGSTSGANRVAIVQVDFIGNKLDDFSIVPMLLERIATLEARVNELENS